MQKMLVKEQICRYNLKRFSSDVSQCCFLSFVLELQDDSSGTFASQKIL